MAKLKRPERGTSTAHVYEELRERIIGQRVSPNMRLVATEIAQLLGVSRTPVRGALERLAQEGYVSQTPAKGFFVTSIGKDEIKHLYEVRVALEVQALHLALQRGIAPAQLAELRRLNNTFTSMTVDDGIGKRGRADVEFHRAMTKLSGNPVLEQLFNNVQDQMAFRRPFDTYYYYNTSSRAARADSQHRAILEAIEAGRNEEATRLLTEHIYAGWEAYAKFMDLRESIADESRPPKSAAKLRGATRPGPARRA